MSPSTLAWRPTTPTISTDRRRERSDDPRTAAALYLDGVRRRCVLDAVVLADDRGGVVASAGAPDEELLARAGTSIVRGEPVVGLDDVDVYAHRVDAGGDAVLVSAGSRVDRVRVVAADLGRILG